MHVLILAFLFLLGTRRWQQLISPQIWDEDGVGVNGAKLGGSNLADYIAHGWSAVFDPVNGYLITVPKLISGLSLLISISHYPIISTVLAWLCIAFVGTAIALAPTRLKGKLLCALAVFLIPSDPEVFGLPLYTFWWTSLLLFLLVLWDDAVPSLGWRLLFLLAGGLSSPVIIVVLPLLYVRVYRYRHRRSEYVVALVATLITIVQMFFIVQTSAGKLPPIHSIISATLPKFFGGILVGNWTDDKDLLAISAVVLLGVLLAWIHRERRNLFAWFLLYLLIASIALSVARVDPAIIHPKNAGPRYFFFPFILMTWCLIQFFFVTSNSAVRAIIGVVFAIVLGNAVPVWSRTHDDLRWLAHLRSCALFSTYAIPIQYDGNESSAWWMQLPGEKCSKLLKTDIFGAPAAKAPTFPYGVARHASSATDTHFTGRIDGNFSDGTGQKIVPEGFRVYSSYLTADADTGELLVSLHRGDRILYHSGPRNNGQTVHIVGHEDEFITDLPNANEWVVLDFSNARLPDEFQARMKDDGRSWGEWFAIAVPR